MMSDYMLKRQGIKNGTVAPAGPKPPKPLNKVSPKTAEKKMQEKKENPVDEKAKVKWFKARRKEMVGVCQCGCGRKSSKFDEVSFQCSACHIFPQHLFPSIQYHPLNWVERNFWDGCHTNMDNQSMDKWPAMADWDDIKERYHNLVDLISDEERAQNFFSLLTTLVYAN